MDPAFPVYIEIEKGGLIKYEYDKDEGKLIVDRVMPASHPYPYAYGFFSGTLGSDGDELDALIISNSDGIKNDTTYNAYIIGALVMEDEHGNDHKVLAIPKTEYETGIIQSLYDMSAETLESIQTFFANYKKNEPDKWSIVSGFVGKSSAMQLYKKSVLSNEITPDQHIYSVESVGVR